jgi:hypothetical protein
MPSEADDFYGRAIGRIRRLTLWVGIGGTLGIVAVKGFGPAAGFLLGAALSILNFQGVTMLADSLGAKRRPGAVAALLIALRYALIGLALYVILRLLGFAPLPVLAGLLVPFGATILEVIYELIFCAHGQ